MSRLDYDQQITDLDGFDANLIGCLEYNPQAAIGLDRIRRVLAVVEGEHDGEDWHWVLERDDGAFVYLAGGCDYTGWDCQSSAWSFVEATAEAAAAHALDFDLTGDRNAPSTEAYDALMRQVYAGQATVTACQAHARDWIARFRRLPVNPNTAAPEESF